MRMTDLFNISKNTRKFYFIFSKLYNACYSISLNLLIRICLFNFTESFNSDLICYYKNRFKLNTFFKIK